MYCRKLHASAWQRYGDRRSWSTIIPLGAPSTLISTLLSSPSPSDRLSLLIGQLQQNQVRCASVQTVFKPWQHQETVMPILLRTSIPDQETDSEPSSPPPSIMPRGGGGIVSDETRKRVATFGCSYAQHSNSLEKDNEDLDIETIEALIEERNDARRKRNFDRADSIRDFLKNHHGVYLNDREGTWGATVSGKGVFLSVSRQAEQFGPTGHDYHLCADAGPSTSPLSEDEIHKLIAERLRCRLNREYERADEIRYILFANKVSVHDIKKLWRADGVSIFLASGRNKNFDYTYDPDAGPSQADIPEEEVLKLLAERRESRFHRDFAMADHLRSILIEAGVRIDDENRMWRADGKSYLPREEGS